MLSESPPGDMRTRALALLCFGLTVACLERKEPPGAGGPPARRAVVSAGSANHRSVEPVPSAESDALGSVNDNLPFQPTGTKLASIAWRTWVYTDVGPKRTRFGYLRAGAVVDARGPAIKNEGCADGWYRINPRGFVCVGKGATTDLQSYAVTANSLRPVRGQALPYLYAKASEIPPFLFFKLPSWENMVELEGEGLRQHIESWRVVMKQRGLESVLEDTPPPPFLSPAEEIIKPYGVKQGLHYAVHAGRAAMDAGFAISRVFTWQGRQFGLTTELDVIALDRTEVVKASSFHGVELGEGEDLPVGFIKGQVAPHFKLEKGEYVPFEKFAYRQGVKLTGVVGGRGVPFLEVRGGTWLTTNSARIIPKRDSFPSFATGSRKWIDISIQDQTLVAYSGTKAVYATLVSTGRGGMGDPEKVLATARGTFMIYAKDVSATMDGNEDKGDSFNLLDVPFVQYFHKGYALHGTYWHDEFGQVRSHGCVNLSPIDAAWLFEWTDPVVPPDWHGRVSPERGTVVYIHG
jgi:lipoprotein-anchoring transpeptidase ErfK/SrfK